MSRAHIGSAVEIRIVGFLPSERDPIKALVHGVVTNDDAGLGILGRDVIVTMDGTALDGNRIIQDLCVGSRQFEVPKCHTGAYVEFRGCELLNDDEILARSLRVVDDGADADIDLDELPALREGFEMSGIEAAAPAP